jgi:DNA processing protein
VSPYAALVRACADVAADGTDPRHLARILAFSVRPRRGADALRRRLLEEGVVDAVGASSVLARSATEVDHDDHRAATPIAHRWAGLGCRVALVGDPAYPARLAEGFPHTDAPVWWVWRGCGDEHRPQVAIVGSRRATTYGAGIAAWLADAVAEAGGRVVSGGAVGIDAAAHRAAAAAAGGTTVVLGCGHAVGYPRPHARRDGLFDEVLRQGGAIASELFPQEPPRPGAVRARNRLVAGIADCVVVVEGGERSGSLLTASAAAERGRPVLAVPGDVRAPGSQAPHRLIAEGAHPCTHPRDLLDVLGDRGAEAPDRGEAGPLRVDGLPPAVGRVLAEHWPRAISLDDLAEATGIAVGSLLATITRAEVAGVVTTDVEGVRLRRAPADPDRSVPGDDPHRTHST